MKSGRVIGGDEHDARTLAQQLVDEARADAERIKAAARAEAERAIAAAQGEAMKLRDDARVLANELVRGARDPVARRDWVSLLARAARSSRTVEIQGSPHVAMHVRSQAVERAIVAG